MRRKSTRRLTSQGSPSITRILNIPSRYASTIPRSIIAPRPRIVQNYNKHIRVALPRIGSTVRMRVRIALPRTRTTDLKNAHFSVKNNRLVQHSKLSADKHVAKNFNRKMYNELRKMGGKKNRRMMAQVHSVKSDKYGLLAANRGSVSSLMAAAAVSRSLGD